VTDPRRHRLDAIAERLARATPGEWSPASIEELLCRAIGTDEGSIGAMITLFEGKQVSSDAHFIARAPADIAWLLSELTRLESSITQARELMREAAECAWFHGERTLAGKLREATKQEGKQ